MASKSVVLGGVAGVLGLGGFTRVLAGLGLTEGSGGGCDTARPGEPLRRDGVKRGVGRVRRLAGRFGVGVARPQGWSGGPPWAGGVACPRLPAYCGPFWRHNTVVGSDEQVNCHYHCISRKPIKMGPKSGRNFWRQTIPPRKKRKGVGGLLLLRPLPLFRGICLKQISEYTGRRQVLKKTGQQVQDTSLGTTISGEDR